MRRILTIVVCSFLVCCTAVALSPGKDLIVAAAGGGSGVGGAEWVTSLQVNNNGKESVSVHASWLVRGQANLLPQTAEFTLAPGETKVFDDALAELFGLEAGGGAIRITADHPVTANAAILNVAGGTEYGQGFVGVPAELALSPGQEGVVLGTRVSDSHRTNIYLADASGVGSAATVSLVDNMGTEIASKAYDLGPYMPILIPVTDLGFEEDIDGALRLSVTSGAIIGGASRVNSGSGDPLTLQASSVSGVQGFATCVPNTWTGRRFYAVHPVRDGDDETIEVEFTSESTAVFSDGPYSVEATFTVVSFGTGAVVHAEMPNLNLSNVQLSVLCETETKGAFVGLGQTPFGPVTISGVGEWLN